MGFCEGLGEQRRIVRNSHNHGRGILSSSRRLGRTIARLYAALPGMGQAEDDAFLASVVQDHHLANELRDLGFEQIQCGTRSMAVASEVKTSREKR